tara:strand:+ start:535 stop:831 length:297 start_codon:yes stop_codon:yes gene_type:complete
MKITGGFHVLAIMAALIGTGFQFYNVKTHKALSYSLPLGLAIMMLFRIPNQICVAWREPHGWFSVVGSAIAMVTYIALTIMTHQESKKYEEELAKSKK